MMVAKFTQGDSIRTTRATRNFSHDPPEPKTHSVDGPKRGNTLNGMPGYITAHEPENMGHAKGGKGFGPHREGPLGKKGSSGAKRMGKGKAAGTTIANYKSASTDSAGSLKGNTTTGARTVHTANRTSKMPGQKPPPTTSGNITGRRVGIDMAVHRAKNEAAAHDQPEGHPGRMERLRGHAKTSMEGRRKSSMY